MITVSPRIKPPLDPDFLPAALWVRTYEKLVREDSNAREVEIVLERDAIDFSIYRTRILSAEHPAAELNFRHLERLLKLLLWQRGGWHVLIYGADECVDSLSSCYGPRGDRAFDYAFIGEKVYRHELLIERAASPHDESVRENASEIGGHLDGCRIGFDLGGSDRKVAAVMEGQVVFSEEIPWDPYFQKDPAYHIEGVQDSLLRAAAHLPRVDAIGGSAAGVYVNNEVRAGSLFRSIPADLFEKQIRRMFLELRERWGGIPFEVVNDGEVTALAGFMASSDGSVLGISMGTSMAGGYVDDKGAIKPWLNELAFVPVDYRPDAPRDEWSGDLGCGVQYFSQQAVARLAGAAGFRFEPGTPFPEQLLLVQEAMKSGDDRARAIYESIGVYLGYTLAHYSAFYPLRNILLLGRVTSGEGGEIILKQANRVLVEEFPELARHIRLRTPNEQEKRHGQAIAAASLPCLKSTSIHT